MIFSEEWSYSDFHTYGNEIRATIFNNETGEVKRIKHHLKPDVFITPKTPDEVTDYKTVFGEPVIKFPCESIKEAKSVIESVKSYNPDGVYAMDNFKIQFSHNAFKHDLRKTNQDIIRLTWFDIETFSGIGGEFPESHEAKYPVTMTSFKDRVTGRIDVFTRTKYQYNKDSKNLKDGLDVNVHHYDNEEDLLLAIVGHIRTSGLMVLAGFNSIQYDLPYLVNRLKRIASHPSDEIITLNTLLPDHYPPETFSNRINERTYTRLSPWDSVYSTERTDDYENPYDFITINGIPHIDYKDVVTKYTYNKLPEKNLDYTATHFLGYKKLDYKKDHLTINHFFRDDPEKFTEYNIVDVDLLDDIEDHVRFLIPLFNTAYLTKTTFSDAMTTMTPWDSYIYGSLKAENVVVPIQKRHIKIPLAGGAVAQPDAGKYQDTIAFDLNSLYPWLIAQWGIDPLTNTGKQVDFLHVDVDPESENFKKIIGFDGLVNMEHDLSFLKEQNLTLSASGYLFDKSIGSFMGDILSSLYGERSVTKKEMLTLEGKDAETGLKDHAGDIIILNGLQMAIKIFMNSVYGAFGASRFRWYLNEIASSITANGQLVIKYIEKRVNDFLVEVTGLDTRHVIYGDTDSIYITLKPVVDMVTVVDLPLNSKKRAEWVLNFSEEVLEPFIDECYTELSEYLNCRGQFMTMKLEKIASSALFQNKKKRYVMDVWYKEGFWYNEPKMNITGMDVVKRGTPEFEKVFYKEVFEHILRTDDKEGLVTILNGQKVRYADMLPHQLSMSSKVGGVNDAEQKGVFAGAYHLKAALVHNRFNRDNNVPISAIRDNDHIQFVQLKHPNPFNHDRVAFKRKFPDEWDASYIDRDLIFQKYWNKIDTFSKTYGFYTKDNDITDNFSLW